MGTLYIIATPIGNLGDFTFRAVETLKDIDVIFCEDTRVTRRLLEHYGLRGKKLISMNARTEEKKIDLLLEHLKKQDVAYMSDAGTPGVSDPGQRIVACAREAGARIVPIPGASAVTTALSVYGGDVSKFCFLGFLPQKKGRQTALQKIASSDEVVILYESKHRILKFLKEAEEFFPDKEITIMRELSKLHEEVLEGTASELLKTLTENPEKQKGEFVLIISN